MKYLERIFVAFSFQLIFVVSVGSAGKCYDTPIFTENLGQWDQNVLFNSQGKGGLTWFIERDGFTIVYSFSDRKIVPLDDGIRLNRRGTRLENEPGNHPCKGHVLKFRFEEGTGLTPPASQWLPHQDHTVQAEEAIPHYRLPWNNNYFLGNDPSKWAPNCGNYERVTMYNVWSGIDIEWHGINGHVEFDFVVHQGIDPEQIGFRVEGLDEEFEIMADGDELLLPTSIGELRMALPKAWTVGMREKKFDITAGFVKVGKNRLRISTPHAYNAYQKLVIDPLVYSTFIGGEGWDGAKGFCPDGMGGTILTGKGYLDFPTTEGAFDREATFCDAIICRVNDDGSDLVFSTFLGGGGNDYSNSITTDEEGAILVTGTTGSEDFPITEGVWDRSHNGGSQDAFVTKLREDGSELIYSTYLGGDRSDHSYHIVCDEDGNAIICGSNISTDFPTTDGAFDEEPDGGGEGFVTCLSEDGSELLWSTLIGGSERDEVIELHITADGEIIAIGDTESRDFPTESAWDDSYDGEQDAFLVKFTDDGSELVFSTFLGGDSEDWGVTVCTNEEGLIFAGGWTDSDDFPTTEGAWDTDFNDSLGSDGYISCFSEDGGEMVFSTYLGGRYDDWVTDICIAEDGGVFLTGSTFSPDFPTTDDAYDPEGASMYDVFITHLSAAGDSLIYSTYLGGQSHDNGKCIYIDGDDEFVVSGQTYSDNFPTTGGAFDRIRNLYSDVFLTRIAVNPLPLFWLEIPALLEVQETGELEILVIGGALDEDAELTIAFHSDDLPVAAEFEDFGNGSGMFTWFTNYEDAGEYTARFILSDGENELAGNVEIIVDNVNRSPVWEDYPEVIEVDEGDTLSFRMVASDPDNDFLMITVFDHNLPDGWEFLDNGDGKGDFTWTPTYDDAGEYSVLFRLTDGGDTLYARVDIDVNDVFSAPKQGVQIPDHYFISEAHPNPFNMQTRIMFGLPVASEVSLNVFDLSGRLVDVMIDEHLAGGIHTFKWQPETLTSGLYFVRLDASGFTKTRKLVLIR